MSPTKEAIEEAKEYLRRRVAAEVSMQSNLEELLNDAARKMIALAKSFNIPPTLFSFTYRYELLHGIDDIVSELLLKIEDACYTLCKATPEAEDSDIIAYVDRETYGSTFRKRTENYVEKFKSEMDDFIRMGLIGGMMLNYNVAWDGFTHKGMSAYNLLNRLTRASIADAWMWADLKKMMRDGAAGYVIRRGSSYDCPLCDSYCNTIYPLTEQHLPIHNRCKCYQVPIYI